MMTQEAVNGALGILVEASIRHDPSSALIGTKILRHATSLQMDNARNYCRIKHGYSDKVIASALAGERAGQAVAAEAVGKG